jgi:hypothetical protein
MQADRILSGAVTATSAQVKAVLRATTKPYKRLMKFYNELVGMHRVHVKSKLSKQLKEVGKDAKLLNNDNENCEDDADD